MIRGTPGQVYSKLVGLGVSSYLDKKEDPGMASALSSASAGAAQTYRKGEECFRKLRSSHPTESTRREWMLCIGRFHSVYLEEPAGELAAASLFLEGVLYQDLHKGLKFDSDQRAARENFEKIVQEYPQSPYAAKAGRELQGMAPSRVESAAVVQPPAAAAPESAAEPRRAPAPGEEGLAAPMPKVEEKRQRRILLPGEA